MSSYVINIPVANRETLTWVTDFHELQGIMLLDYLANLCSIAIN